MIQNIVFFDFYDTDNVYKFSCFPLKFELSSSIDEILPNGKITFSKVNFYILNNKYYFRTKFQSLQFDVGYKVKLNIYAGQGLNPPFPIVKDEEWEIENINFDGDKLELEVYKFRELLRPKKKYKKLFYKNNGQDYKIVDIFKEVVKECQCTFNYNYDSCWDEQIGAFVLEQEYYTPYLVLEKFKDILPDCYAYVKNNGEVNIGFKHTPKTNPIEYKYMYPFDKEKNKNGYSVIIGHKFDYNNIDKSKVLIKITTTETKDKKTKKLVARYPETGNEAADFTDVRSINFNNKTGISEELAKKLVKNTWENIKIGVSGNFTTYVIPRLNVSDTVVLNFDWTSFSTQIIKPYLEFQEEKYYINGVTLSWDSNGLRQVIDIEKQ